MAYDYSADRDGFAYDLLSEFNQATFSWEPHTGISGDPAAGTGSSTYGTAFAVKGVVKTYALRDVDGTMVQRDDRELILDAKSFNDAGVVPDDDDRVTISSVLYQVVRVEPKPGGDTPIIYKVQVRAK